MARRVLPQDGQIETRMQRGGEEEEEEEAQSSDSDDEGNLLNVGDDKARIKALERRVELLSRATTARHQEDDREGQRFEQTIQAFKVALGHRTPPLLEEIPCFSGTLPTDLSKGVSLQRFLQVVERATSSPEWTTKQRIQTVRKHLRGLAACQVDKPEFVGLENWEEFKKKLKLCFKDVFQPSILWQRLSQVRRKAKEDFTNFYARLNETALQLGLFSDGDTAPAEMAIRTALLQALPPTCKFLFADPTAPLSRSLEMAIDYVEEQPHLQFTKRHIAAETTPLYPTQSTLPPWEVPTTQTTTQQQAVSWPLSSHTTTTVAVPSSSITPQVTKSAVAALTSADDGMVSDRKGKYCQVCQDTSHWTVHCRLLKSSDSGVTKNVHQDNLGLESPQKRRRVHSFEDRACYNCHQVGHIARQCHRRGPKNYSGLSQLTRPPAPHHQTHPPANPSTNPKSSQ